MAKDIELIKQRFESNFKSYNKLALIQQQICNELADLLSELCTNDISRAMEIGAGTGFLTSHLIKRYPTSTWFINDLTPSSESYITDFVQNTPHTYLWGDAESLTMPDNLDLIASASTLQWFDDFDNFISKAKRATREGGYLAITTFGVENFKEINTTLGEGLNYLNYKEIANILEKNGYKIIRSLDYTKSLQFDTPIDVLRHIKQTGVNSIKRQRMTRKRLLKFEQDYANHYLNSNGKVYLTYHPIIILCQLDSF